MAQQDIKHYPLYNSFDYFSIWEDAGAKVSIVYGEDDVFTGNVETVKIHLSDETFKD